MTCLVYICSLTTELHSNRGLVEKDKNPRATHICAYDTARISLTEKSRSNAAQWASSMHAPAPTYLLSQRS